MERTDLLALVCDVYCDFVIFPFGILGQVWYLIVSIPGPCCLSYFYTYGLCVENKFQLLAAVVKISPVYVTILDYDYNACGCSVL